MTFWPIGEVVKAAAGIVETDSKEEAWSKLGSLLGSEQDPARIEETVAGLIGLGPPRGSLEEAFWAVRRLLEALAKNRPLVIVVDDLHWAEPTLLDLIVHVADWSTDAPITFYCLARPE